MSGTNINLHTRTYSLTRGVVKDIGFGWFVVWTFCLLIVLLGFVSVSFNWYWPLEKIIGG